MGVTAEAARPRIAVVFTGLLLVMFMAALDGTIVSTALPTIVGDLGGLDHISWVVTAYLLAQTAVCPLYGKLGDQYGRKLVLQAGLVIFLVGSGLCGQAQSMGELIAFRALQGLGAGGLMVGAQAAIGDVVSPRERGRYVGAFGAVFGVATVLGPLLGGALTEISWRWIFYVNVPIGVAALVVLQATLPASGERVRHSIDYAGAALLAGSLSCVILLTTLGGNSFAWDSPEIIGLGAGGLALLGLFLVAERRAAEPVLPISLLRNPVFAVTSAIGLLVGLALFGGTTYIPLFLQVVNDATPTESGLQLLPMMLGLLVTSVGSGQIISRTGHYKPFPILGCAIMAAGLFGLATMDSATGSAEAAAFMFVFGLGIGLVMQVLVLAVQNAVDYTELGVATSGSTLFRLIGGALGTAVLGTIFTNGLSSALADKVPPGTPGGAELSSGSVEPEQVAGLPEPLRSDYIDAFAGSLDNVFVVAGALAVVGFGLAFLLRELPLRDTVGAAGVGEALAMPKQHDSLSEMERSIWSLLGRDARKRVLERIAARAGVDLGAAECWLLARVGEEEGVRVAELARRHAIDTGRLEDALAELERRELVAGAEPERSLTPAGREVLERLYTARREGLAELLDGWSPEGSEELAAMLERLSRRLSPEVPA